MQSDAGVASVCWALSQFYQKDADVESLDETAPAVLAWLLHRAGDCLFSAKTQITLLVFSMFRRMPAQRLPPDAVARIIDLLEEVVAVGTAPAVLWEAQFPIAAMRDRGGEERERAEAIAETLRDAWIDHASGERTLALLDREESNCGLSG
jgi:hypothetical protein